MAALVDPVAPARLDDVDYLTVPLSGILFGLLKEVQANAHGIAAAPWPEHGATVATSYLLRLSLLRVVCRRQESQQIIEFLSRNESKTVTNQVVRVKRFFWNEYKKNVALALSCIELKVQVLYPHPRNRNLKVERMVEDGRDEGSCYQSVQMEVSAG